MTDSECGLGEYNIPKMLSIDLLKGGGLGRQICFGKGIRFRLGQAYCLEQNRSWSNESFLPGCENGTVKGKSVGS